MPRERQYSEIMLESMQAAYGEGFLSPGGAREVAAILDGLALAGREVLDIGCGVGGGALVMARDLGAGRVLGIDVEAAALERATQRVAAAGLGARIELRLIEPGPLPLGDGLFDLAYSNDVVCHFADKVAFFTEVLRTLRPGGVFAFGDWVVGDAAGPDSVERALFDDWAAQLRAGGLTFFFEPAAAYAKALRAAGFSRIESGDNSAWAEEVAKAQFEQAQGPGRQAAIEALGEAAYERRQRLTKTRWDALRRGALGHGLIRAWKAS